VTSAAVGLVTRAFLAMGLVKEVDCAASTGGRPSQMLALAGDAGRAVGVKVALDHLTAVEMRLDGEVTRWSVDGFDAAAPQTKSLALLAQYLEAFVGKGAGDVPLIGVGACVPGVVEEPDAGVADVPSFGWRGVPLGRYLRGVLGVPVLVENGVKALAFSELLYGIGRRHKNFALLTIGRGVGFAVVANREVQRGSGGAAGEIGHVVVVPGGPPCACGARGCLESFASDDGLRAAGRRAGALRASEATGRLAELAGEGDQRALSVYAEAASVLGSFLAGPLSALEPEVLIVAGEGSASWRYWDRPFREALQGHLPAGWPELPVKASGWQDSSWAQGAAAIVLAAVFDPSSVAGRQRADVLARLQRRPKRAEGSSLVLAGSGS